MSTCKHILCAQTIVKECLKTWKNKDVIEDMSHVNIIMQDLGVQSLFQINVHIRKPIVVDIINEKLLIMLSEAET